VRGATTRALRSGLQYQGPVRPGPSALRASAL